MTSDECYDKYINEQKKSKGRADCFRISKPKGKSIHGLLSKPVETGDEQLAQAAVRDGISSFDVLLMQLSLMRKFIFCLTNMAVQRYQSALMMKNVAE